MHRKTILFFLFLSTASFCKKAKQIESIQKVYLKNKQLVLKDCNFNYSLPTTYYVDQISGG